MDFKTRFKEDHPNTPIPDKSFGVLGPGSLVQIKQDGQWIDGIIDKILYAVDEKQVTFFVRIAYGIVCSIPHREGEILSDLKFSEQAKAKRGMTETMFINPERD